MEMLKKREIRDSLTNKGFQEISSKHSKFVLFVNGVAVGVHTVMSHGGGEPGKDLLQEMKRQLYFDSQADFTKFVKCKISYEEYVSFLKKRGVIPH